jgi:hypothetical protein
MKYIVIQGRMPQDGSKARTALFVYPSWISSTLVCAGVVGRVIELTDGNILEEGGLPECATEESFLQIMEEMRDSITPSEATPAATHIKASIDPDDAYREGNQAMRVAIQKTMIDLGMPEDAKPGVWMKEQLDELSNCRAQLKQFEGGATRQRFDETLAELQTEQANLDAWRTAAGASGLCIEYNGAGQVRKIYSAAESGGPSHPELLDSYQAVQEDYDKLLALVVAEGYEIATHPDGRTVELCNAGNAALYTELREQLQRANAQLLERPTVMNFTGPVTINTTEVVVAE